MTYKKFNRLVICLSVIILLFFASLIIYVDPYFHYHKPFDNIRYILDSERYQNDGIVKNFNYDALITGTSMTENFKPSEFNDLFNTNNCIKVPFSGGSIKEVGDNLNRAFDHNSNIKYVVRGLDKGMLTDDKDTVRTDYKFPEYLYNNNILDDVSYIFNKEVFFGITMKFIEKTRNKGSSTTFDDYSYWSDDFTYGRESVLSTYTRPNIVKGEYVLTEEEKQREIENLKLNVINMANENPDTTFYLFFTPYSICYWDRNIYCTGRIKAEIEIQKIAIEELINYDNIKLYSFDNNFELICNLDNYKDPGHYSGQVNSKILKWIKDEKYLLTADNYQQYLDEIKEFYSDYDYDSIYK